MLLNKARLLTPGPTPLPEQVRLALAKDAVHHRERNFSALLLKVEEQLKVLFGTQEPVLPLASSGTGAMTAAVDSLFSPGDKVIVINAGKFGERWSLIARARGLQVVELCYEWGLAANPEDIETCLEENRDARGLLVQLSETSTGVLHPVQDIAAKLKNSGVLLVVDGISGVGICPCPMDEWGIDCLLTGSQKGLMLPPGLAFIALSARAWKVAEKTRGSFYFNLPKERASLAKGQTNFTTPVNLIQGLDAAMDLILADGLDVLYRKQWALTMLCRRGIQAMGLVPFARRNYTWGLTSVLLPDAVSGASVQADCTQKWGVTISGGQDTLKGRIVRVAHMGWIDWADVTAALYALNRSLIDNGAFCGSHAFLEQGLASYRAALAGEPGVEPDIVHN